MDSELKPCPFCGGDHVAAHKHFWHVVLCLSCGAEGPAVKEEDAADEDAAKAEAIAAWNRRALDATPAVGWRDIASAPERGPILVCDTEARQPCVLWAGVPAPNRPGHWYTTSNVTVRPTHWMPPPTLPTVATPPETADERQAAKCDCDGFSFGHEPGCKSEWGR